MELYIMIVINLLSFLKIRLIRFVMYGFRLLLWFCKFINYEVKNIKVLLIV